jgi:CheY-like chemotaxis protein
MRPRCGKKSPTEKRNFDLIFPELPDLAYIAAGKSIQMGPDGRNMSVLATPSTLWIGPADGCSGQAHEVLAATSRLTTVADRPSAIARITESNAPPELIVVAQSLPGEHGQSGFDALRAAAPLAAIGRVLGSWCEGEARSGHPPAGCANYYWHQAPARLSREIASLQHDRCPTWGLPRTATADEQLLALDQRPLERGVGTIALCVERTQDFAALRDACRLAGYDTQSLTPVQNWEHRAVAATLWDTTVEGLSDVTLLQRLRGCTGDAPILALIGFPRPDDVQRAAEIGLAGVISKPFLLADLFWQLGQATGASA